MPMWKLTPACKDYLWGGEKLREKYHIESDWRRPGCFPATRTA